MNTVRFRLLARVFVVAVLAAFAFAPVGVKANAPSCASSQTACTACCEKFEADCVARGGTYTGGCSYSSGGGSSSCDSGGCFGG